MGTIKNPSGASWGNVGRGGDSFRKVNLSNITLSVKVFLARWGWLYRGQS